MNTAAKVHMLDEGQLKNIIGIMSTLNKYAKEAMAGLKVHSCTDVTGFSLTGHSYEMASGSERTIEIYTDQVPVIDGALDLAAMGIIPEGMYNNLDYLADKYIYKNTLPQNLKDLLLDPQTSGGLLISLPEKDANEFLKRMEEHTPYAKIIGQVTEKKEKPLLIY